MSLGKANAVPTDQIETGRLQRFELSRIERFRLKHVYDTLDVETLTGESFEGWAGAFLRDRNVEREIGAWERIASRYSEYVALHDLSADAKHDVYNVLLLRSMIGSSDLPSDLKLRSLSRNDAKEVMRHF
jgi:hypothetical protein